MHFWECWIEEHQKVAHGTFGLEGVHRSEPETEPTNRLMVVSRLQLDVPVFIEYESPYYGPYPGNGSLRLPVLGNFLVLDVSG